MRDCLGFPKPRLSLHSYINYTAIAVGNHSITYLHFDKQMMDDGLQKNAFLDPASG